MATVTDGAILELVIHSTLNLQRQMTVLHYRLSDSSSPADQFGKLANADLRFAAADGPYDAIAAASGSDCEFQLVQLQWIYPTRYAYRRFDSMPLVGQDDQPCYPSNVSATITKRGEEANRHNIGAVHLPNVPIEKIVGGKFVPGYLTTLEALAVALKTPYTMATGGTLTPILANKANLAASVPVATTVVQEYSRVQRRRTVGLGI